MLKASQINVVLNTRTILEQIDFSAHAGELTTIVGPNGSGKTTLLRTLTGDLPFEGKIEFNGQNIRELHGWQLAEQRAVLSQSTPMAFPFTVYEVVRIGLSNSDSADSKKRIIEAIAHVGLSGYESRIYQQLSGGEQQRVQLARALLQVWNPVHKGQPRWLLLDEPVASLDIKHQLEVMRLAKHFASEGGGVIAVMHDLNLTAMFADSVAMLNDGRFLRQGRPEQVFTDQQLSKAYSCQLKVNTLPTDGQPYLLPHACSLFESLT